MAKLCNFPKDDTSADLAKVAQFCDVVLGSSELRHNLLHLFDHDQPPSSLHRYLAAIEHPLLIVTTNYDDLIEQAFREAGREFHLVVHASIAGKRRHVLWRPPSSETYEAVPTKTFELEVDEHPVIYKMHGSCDVEDSMAQRHFVITEDDYADFLGRMNSNAAIPNAFAEPFRERSFLFLGYSLNDWNLRVVLSQIRSQLAGSATNWAIQRDVAPVEREIWRQRNVRIYDMTIDALVEGLSR